MLAITGFYSEGNLSFARAKGEETEGVHILAFASAAGIAKSAERRELIGPLSTLNRPLISIREQAHRWYSLLGNAEKVRKVVEGEMTRAGVGRIDPIGASMGGYAALSMVVLLPIRYALSFVRQFSTDPVIIADPRYQTHLAEIRKDFELSTAQAGCAAMVSALIVQGLDGPDLRHMKPYSGLDPDDRRVFLEPTHFIAKRLKDTEDLRSFVRAALSGKQEEVRDILRQNGAVRAKRIAKFLEPIVAGFDAQRREEARAKETLYQRAGRHARSAMTRIFGAEGNPGLASNTRRKETP